MRLLPSLLLILCLAGCQHGGANDTDAVRQGVIDRLAKQKFDISAMDIKVASVQFNGEQADATVAVTLKGKGDSPPMSFRYHLERQAKKWVVTGLANDNAHGGAGGADPGMGANPHGGAMPPAAGGAANPHGGMAPAGGAGSMPSPQDLPPAKKK